MLHFWPAACRGRAATAARANDGPGGRMDGRFRTGGRRPRHASCPHDFYGSTTRSTGVIGHTVPRGLGTRTAYDGPPPERRQGDADGRRRGVA